MKYKRTPIFDYNYRRGRFPLLSLENYQALIAGEIIELDDDTAKAMQESGLVEPVTEGGK